MTNNNAADIFVFSMVAMVGAVAFIVVGVYVILPCAAVFGIYKLIPYLNRPKPQTTEELYRKAQVTYFPTEETFLEHFGDKLFEPLDDYPTEKVIYALLSIAQDLYRAENLACTPILAPREATLDEAKYRDQLIARAGKAINPLPIFNQIQDAITASLNVFIKAFFKAAFTEGEPKYTVPLKDTLSSLPKLVDEICLFFFYPSIIDAGLFKGLRARLAANGDAVDIKKTIMPEDYKGDDVVETYLGGTALEQLFSARVSIVIPQEAYFEGQWIVAPPGAGKTQCIQTYSA